MPDICAIVENWEAPILGQNFSCGLHSPPSRAAGCMAIIEGCEKVCCAPEHPLNARSNPSYEDGRNSADMIAYVDGSSRGHSGAAGIGVVIEHPGGRRVEISQSISARDNNYAEYAALLAALEYASAYALPRLQVYSDSEVVVRQISGSYTCQSQALREIYQACKSLIGSLQHFAITHIPREANANADRLAKEAIERDAERQEIADGPSDLPGSPGRLVPVEQTG
jgi:ribonuclease HI